MIVASYLSTHHMYTQEQILKKVCIIVWKYKFAVLYLQIY